MFNLEMIAGLVFVALFFILVLAENFYANRYLEIPKWANISKKIRYALLPIGMLLLIYSIYFVPGEIQGIKV